MRKAPSLPERTPRSFLRRDGLFTPADQAVASRGPNPLEFLSSDDFSIDQRWSIRRQEDPVWFPAVAIDHHPVEAVGTRIVDFDDDWESQFDLARQSREGEITPHTDADAAGA